MSPGEDFTSWHFAGTVAGTKAVIFGTHVVSTQGKAEPPDLLIYDLSTGSWTTNTLDFHWWYGTAAASAGGKAVFAGEKTVGESQVAIYQP